MYGLICVGIIVLDIDISLNSRKLATISGNSCGAGLIGFRVVSCGCESIDGQDARYDRNQEYCGTDSDDFFHLKITLSLVKNLMRS